MSALPHRKPSEPTFATAKPGELYRAPDGCLKRKPALSLVAPVGVPAKPLERPQQPKPSVPKADSLKSPLRGQKPVKRGKARLPDWCVSVVAGHVAFIENLPLRVGILEDLVNAGTDQKTAMFFLKLWTNRTEYLEVIAKGTTRHRLDGTVDGEVPEKHRAFALKKLAARAKEQP